MKHSMYWLIGFASLGLAATVSEAPAQEPSVSIQTEYLGTLEVQLDAPQAVGPVLIFNVPGGTLKGPKINGTVVAGYDKPALVTSGKLKSTDGIYGIRVNHMLEVHIDGFSASKM